MLYLCSMSVALQTCIVGAKNLNATDFRARVVCRIEVSRYIPFIRNMPLQVCFDHFTEIIATKFDRVEHLYSFYARSLNGV